MTSPKLSVRYLLILVTAHVLVGCSQPTTKSIDRLRLPSLDITECWFTNTLDLPPHDCYYMNVYESSETADSRTVSFPVIVFESQNDHASNNPLLHLGGGGPGAELGLAIEYNVRSIYEQMKTLSVDLGRDLYLIDPRGAGQSRPKLMCQRFVDNVVTRWRRPLSLRQSYDEGHADFEFCIEEFKVKGIDFSAYHSLAVIDDLEQLRRARDVDQWVLYGSSYASVYAQLYAREFPAQIESMILDSTTFLDIAQHEVQVRETVEPYNRLFDHCEVTKICTNQKTVVANRFWALVSKLDQTPINMVVTQPNSDDDIYIVLTGWRFLDAMLWGVYDEDIFHDFPLILDELERGDTTKVKRYVEEIMRFLTDDSFGDISASSHYCQERKPYRNKEKMTQAISEIPYEYARSIALMGLEYSDYCEHLGIPSVSSDLADPITTDVPTLFIHGKYDSVTLLDYVTERKKNFSNSHLVTSDQAHIVLDSACMQKTVSQFLRNGLTDYLVTDCGAD